MFNKKRENARVVRAFGGSLKASLPKGLRYVAFTMAEILLSLTIIGVVAAITLPSLTGNINERTWNTQRKALYSRLSQAIALMPQIRGYGMEVDDSLYAQNDVMPKATITFLTNGLSKVMKLNNVCDESALGDCGIPNEVVNLKGGKTPLATSAWTMTSYYRPFEYVGCGLNKPVYTYAAAFETQNGESVLVHYNPYCNDEATALNHNWRMAPVAVFCANFIYDLNGKKGPNTVGKDIGVMGLLYPSNSVLVSVQPSPKDYSGSAAFSRSSAVSVCKNSGDDLRLPNKEEAIVMAVNYELFQIEGNYWTASPTSSLLTSRMGYVSYHYIDMQRDYAMVETASASSAYKVRCIKR